MGNPIMVVVVGDTGWEFDPDAVRAEVKLMGLRLSGPEGVGEVSVRPNQRGGAGRQGRNRQHHRSTACAGSGGGRVACASTRPTPGRSSSGARRRRFLVARVVMSGGVGRLRFGDRPTDPGGDPTGRPSGGGDGASGF